MHECASSQLLQSIKFLERYVSLDHNHEKHTRWCTQGGCHDNMRILMIQMNKIHINGFSTYDIPFDRDHKDSIQFSLYRSHNEVGHFASAIKKNQHQHQSWALTFIPTCKTKRQRYDFSSKLILFWIELISRIFVCMSLLRSANCLIFVVSATLGVASFVEVFCWLESFVFSSSCWKWKTKKNENFCNLPKN